MRIAIFQTGPLGPGGAEFVVHHTANHLAKAGNDVVVFVGKPISGKSPTAIYEMLPHHYHVHKFTCPIAKGLSRPWAQWNLIRVVKSTRCDVVHAHVLHSSGQIAVRSRSLIGVPVLITAHGEDIQMDAELGHGYRLQPRHDRAVRFALENADGVTAISRAMAREMVDAGGRSDRLWVVPNGIDPVPWKNVAPLVEKRPYILAMGRLVPKKGFEVLLRAFSQVIQKEESEIDLCIAGDGPQKQSLQELAGQLRLGDRVRFVGYLNEEKKAPALAGALFFVCPSLREPFGIVNLEAMASSRAVIATDIDGIPDLIQTGRNGLLFPRGDVPALASCILKLLRNPELSRDMGQTGRTMVAEFTWETIAAKYLDIYREIRQTPRTVIQTKRCG
jgi:glycosyltransferase involved in cell wall biosynthesis